MCKNGSNANGPIEPNGPKRSKKSDQILLAIQIHRYAKVWPDYSDYREKTSILIPLIGYQYIPSLIKKTLLCEWKMYASVRRDQAE